MCIEGLYLSCSTTRSPVGCDVSVGNGIGISDPCSTKQCNIYTVASQNILKETFVH